jgi:hypothetical protein
MLTAQTNQARQALLDAYTLHPQQPNGALDSLVRLLLSAKEASAAHHEGRLRCVLYSFLWVIDAFCFCGLINAFSFLWVNRRVLPFVRRSWGLPCCLACLSFGGVVVLDLLLVVGCFGFLVLVVCCCFWWLLLLLCFFYSCVKQMMLKTVHVRGFTWLLHLRCVRCPPPHSKFARFRLLVLSPVRPSARLPSVNVFLFLFSIAPPPPLQFVLICEFCDL